MFLSASDTLDIRLQTFCHFFLHSVILFSQFHIRLNTQSSSLLAKKKTVFKRSGLSDRLNCSASITRDESGSLQ